MRVEPDSPAMMNEKTHVAHWNLIGTLLRKEVPEILEYFLFHPLSQLENEAPSDLIENSEGSLVRTIPLKDLGKTFLQQFTLASDYAPGNIAIAISQTPLKYFLQAEDRDQAVQETQGGEWYLKSLQSRIGQWMSNLPEENVLLAEQLKFVLSMPFKEDDAQLGES